MLRMYQAAPDGALADDLRVMLPWLSVQAILTVPIGQLFGSFALPLALDEATYSTFFFVFTWHQYLDGSLLIRPDGLFWEPGVFQIYLNLHLFMALFVYRNWPQAILATIAVLATQSTTGLVIKTLNVIRTDLEASFRQVFGLSIPLGDLTLLGQIIGILAAAYAELWALIQAVYSTMDQGP